MCKDKEPDIRVFTYLCKLSRKTTKLVYCFLSEIQHLHYDILIFGFTLSPFYGRRMVKSGSPPFIEVVISFVTGMVVLVPMYNSENADRVFDTFIRTA